MILSTLLAGTGSKPLHVCIFYISDPNDSELLVASCCSFRSNLHFLPSPSLSSSGEPSTKVVEWIVRGGVFVHQEVLLALATGVIAVFLEVGADADTIVVFQ